MPHALTLLSALALAAMVAPGRAQEMVPRSELAPTGTLRVGLVEAPSAGVLFVARGRDGGPVGVTADLSAELAPRGRAADRGHGVPQHGRGGAAAIQAGTIDVSYMPVDAARRQVLDFGPGYYDLESTYLASAASGIADVAEVDRPGVRVGRSTARRPSAPPSAH